MGMERGVGGGGGGAGGVVGVPGGVCVQDVLHAAVHTRQCIREAIRIVHDMVYPRARADNGIVAVEVVERSVETAATFSAQCAVACGTGKSVGGMALS